MKCFVILQVRSEGTRINDRLLAAAGEGQASRRTAHKVRISNSYEFYHESLITVAFALSRWTPTYRLQIYGDASDHDAPLRLRHLPPGPQFTEVDTRSG